MACFDVFNGDADGICALTQLRNAFPADSNLITGVKRDIQLLDRVSTCPGDSVTVLDISMDKNRDALQRVLKEGAEVFYADHHYAGDIPSHPRLIAMINMAPDICTSMLINQHLEGQFTAWAVVGAFGDNLRKSAIALAKPLGLNEKQLQQLENLGVCINYNGYGAAIEDLHFDPEQLYRLVSPYADPFEFMAGSPETWQKLDTGYQEDMAAAKAIEAEYEADHAAVFILPNASWSRRVSGVFGNELANEYPERAHAVITERKDGGYLISVRAPLNNKVGADEICRGFPTGGGRQAAAGINNLPEAQLGEFVSHFSGWYS
jgi:cytochrome oxidase Cu insertion factor (SCO1/SenC/PrrC family)